jgi:hypothetical protein
MSPVIRTNILLILLAVILSLGIYIHYQQPEQFYTKVTRIVPQQVRKISIQKDNKTLAALKKQGAQWTDSIHDNAPVDEAWTDKLLHLSQLPSLYHFPTGDKNLKDFGLAPPRYTLKLDDVHILFGKLDPATGLRFAQTDNQIHLISDSYTHYLYQQPSD